MRHIISIAFMAVLLGAAAPSGFSQLRNLSEYSQDCIHPDKTYFVLHDTGAADFGWASEWTHTTANAFPDKAAILLWKLRMDQRRTRGRVTSSETWVKPQDIW